MEGNTPDDEWPTEGVVEFDQYSTRYRPGLDLVLKGVSFKVIQGEKVRASQWTDNVTITSLSRQNNVTTSYRKLKTQKYLCPFIGEERALPWYPCVRKTIFQLGSVNLFTYNKTMTGARYRSHYCDVIMSVMASQIAGISIVCSTVGSCADQRKHQSSESQAFVRRVHWWLVDSPHKWPVTRKMFHWMTSSYETMKSQRTFHTSPSRARYGVPSVSIYMKYIVLWTHCMESFVSSSWA